MRCLIVLICDSLIQFFDIQHLFLCLFVASLFFDKVCLFRSFAHFLNCIIHFLVVEFKSSLDILDNNPLSDVSCKYFLLVCELSSISLTSLS